MGRRRKTKRKARPASAKPTIVEDPNKKPEGEEKAIDPAGGKKNPAQGLPGGSGIRPRERKKADLRPDTDPGRLSTGELVAAHWALHRLYGVRKGSTWTTEDLTNVHAAIVDELFERKVDHPAPPDTGLDGNSISFETYSAKQAGDWTRPPAHPGGLPELDFVEARISKPFSSPGGKDLWAKRIAASLPAHKVYVEPYAGSGTVFFAKAPSDVEVLSDVNPEIVNMLQFTQRGSDQDFEWMRSQDWKWSREHFEQLKKASPSGVRERAYKFKYLNLYSYRGQGEKFNPTATASKETNGGEFVRKLEAWRERLNGVKILQKDALEVMREYDSAKTAFYVDPPWKKLASGDEWKGFDAGKFAEAMKKLKGQALVSYQGEIDLGKGWNSRALSVTQGGVAGTSTQKILANFKTTGFDDQVAKADQVAAEAVHAGMLAERSKTEDSIHLGRAFPVPTPVRFLAKGELQSPELALRLLSRPGWLPAVVQKATEGVEVQAHRDGDRVKILTAGVDITGRIPGIVKAIAGLKADEFALVGTLEAWRGRHRLPAEAVEDHLAGKVDFSRELVLSVSDLPYRGADVHKSDTAERFGGARAAELGIPQLTMGAPDARASLNAIVGVEVRTLGEAEKAIRRILTLPGAAGVIVKQAGAEFELAGETSKWAEFPLVTELHAVIVDREETNEDRWVFRCASLPGSFTGDLVTLEGVDYLPIGSFESTEPLGPGAKVRVEADLVTVAKDVGGDRVKAEPLRLLGLADQLDTADQLVDRARSDFALREYEGGELRQPERPITKQGDPYMEIPPERPYRYAVHAHYQGGEFRTELRTELRPGRTLIGWSLKSQTSPVEPVTSLSQARALDPAEASRIDWNSGEWGAGVKAFKRAPHPYAWIDVEGATPNPVEGEPPPVGSSGEWPGVFRIIDKGLVEYGSQRSDLHEYFFAGSALRGRVIVRKVLRADGGSDWIATHDASPTPYALTANAVKKGWIPPVGISALPEAARSQVPAELRYWERPSSVEARATRDELVAKLAAGGVKVDFDAAFFPVAKASDTDARFVLQRQTFAGKVELDLPERAIWYIRLDSGGPDLTVISMKIDPVENPELPASVGQSRHRESMKVAGELGPAHYLNPAKGASSSIERVDSGRAIVLLRSPDYLKIKLSGKVLRGCFGVRKQRDRWEWGPDEGGPSSIAKRLSVDEDARVAVPILKVAAEKQLATGVVLEPDEVDAQGDTQSAEVIQEAAHEFLSVYNRATELGINHKIFGEIGVELAESWIAPFDLQLGSQAVKAGSWIMTVKFTDPRRWAQVKRGAITGFSIGGWASVKDPKASK